MKKKLLVVAVVLVLLLGLNATAVSAGPLGGGGLPVEPAIQTIADIDPPFDYPCTDDYAGDDKVCYLTPVSP